MAWELAKGTGRTHPGIKQPDRFGASRESGVTDVQFQCKESRTVNPPRTHQIVCRYKSSTVSSQAEHLHELSDSKQFGTASLIRPGDKRGCLVVEY